MRRARSYVPFMFALIFLAACSGGPAESQGGNASQQPGASQPAASQPGASQPAASQGGGSGIGVTLSDGGWTGGDAHATISGDGSASIDAPLQPVTSLTTGGSTTLVYISTEGQLIGIALYSDSFAISVTTGEFVGGGGTTTTCDLTWHSTDDDNISADFSCPNSPIVTTAGSLAGTIDIDGSFSATR